VTECATADVADWLESLDADALPPVASAATPALSPSSITDRLRARHHQLARYIAEGKAVREAAFIVGYAPATVGGYMQDPAFRELVDYYKAQVHHEYLDMHHRLGSLAATAVDILHERLEERPAAFTNNELRQIINDACDRSVAPSKGAGAGSGVSINVRFVKAEPQAPIIDMTAERTSP
jgi:hypothetical protein